MSTSATADLPGWTVVRSAVSLARCSAWLAAIDRAYARLAGSSSPDFVPESSSFRLRAITDVPVTDVWSALSAEVRTRAAALLGPLLAIDIDQCWVRRQYAPRVAPPRHHPHSWHQDGALGFRFDPAGRATIPADALLRMVTCWIALTPCGLDAPGLEFVPDRFDRLLSPAELIDPAVEGRWPTPTRTRPTLDAGDVLVFSGDVVHRTHVTPVMNGTRTSIELRCFRADPLPDRLAGDAFTMALATGDHTA